MRRINEHRPRRGRAAAARVVLLGAATATAALAIGPGAGATTNVEAEPDVTAMGTQEELVRMVASHVTLGSATTP